MSASLKSVFLSDFTSHAETKIDLAPPGGLTMLAGKTAAGKSQIVRALRLLCYNIPAGYEYIRTGRSTATVALELSDGTKVARERSRSVNRYRIVKQGESPHVFEGFGLGVPLEVQEATGVQTVTIGESLDLALNLSEQLDGPFLGNKVASGPARAKILGSLAGTEEVDEAHRGLGTDLLHATQDAARLEEDIGNLQTRIDEYDYLGSLNEKIGSLDAILTEVRALQSRLATLESLSAKLAGIDYQRIQALNSLARWGGLPAAVSHVECAGANLAKTQALSSHSASLGSVATQRAEWGRRLTRWAGLEEGEKAYSAAEAAWSRARSLDGSLTVLLVTHEGIAKAQVAAARWTNVSAADSAMSACSEALTRLQALQALNTRLVGLWTDVANASRSRARWANLMSVDLRASTVIPDLSSRVSILTQHSGALARIRQSRVVAEDSLSQHAKALGDAQSLYTDTLVAMGVCPVCGSKVDPESISLHIKEVA